MVQDAEQCTYLHKRSCKQFLILTPQERWQALAEWAFENAFKQPSNILITAVPDDLDSLDAWRFQRLFRQQPITLNDQAYPFKEGTSPEKKFQQLEECADQALISRNHWKRPQSGWKKDELVNVNAWIQEARNSFDENVGRCSDSLERVLGQSSTNWFAGSQTDRILLYADFIVNRPDCLEDWNVAPLSPLLSIEMPLELKLRAKSQLPLFELKDRLDYKQALIEISLLDDGKRFLSLIPPNSSKSQQLEAIRYFLEEEEFKGWPRGTDRQSIPPTMILQGYQHFIDNFKHDFDIRFRANEFAGKMHNFMEVYKADKALGLKIDHPKIGIFSKSLAECLENDKKMAMFILACVPDFPEDLPEIDQTGQNQGSGENSKSDHHAEGKIQIIYDRNSETASVNGVNVLSSRQKNAWKMFTALAEVKKLSKNALKSKIWEDNDTPEGWDRLIHEAGGFIRSKFNDSPISSLGDELLPHATSSFYQFNLQKIEIVKMG